MVPSSIELQALARRQPVVIKVRFMDGLEKAFVVDSATNALEAHDIVVNGIHLNDSLGFSLYEVYNNIERKLSPADNLADAISKAESLAKSMKGKKIAFTFLFKKSVYHPSKPYYIDIIERDLMFAQVYSDFYEGRLICDEELAVKLAAFKLQIDVGVYDSQRTIDDIRVLYLPEYLRSRRTLEDWKQLIFYQHSLLISKSIDDIKNEYLTVVQQLPLYGAALFRNLESKTPMPPVPNKFDVAINITGIHFLDTATKAVLKTITFSELKSYNCPNPTTLVLSLSRAQTVTLDCEGEGVRMVTVLREHVETLQGSAQFARALFDYDVSDEHLLSFKKGDIITLIEKDAKGWYVGELKGKSGSFPTEYVEILLENPANASKYTFKQFYIINNISIEKVAQLVGHQYEVA